MQSREAKKQELIFSDHYVKCFSLKEFYKLFFFSLLKYYFYLFLSVPLNTDLWSLERKADCTTDLLSFYFSFTSPLFNCPA